MYSLVNKKHISFSELKIWSECTYRHKLSYIDKLDTYEPSTYTVFGNCVHECIEDYLKTRNLNIDKCIEEITAQWESHGFDSEEYINKMVDQRRAANLNYKHEALPLWITYAKNILVNFPTWLDDTFPNWEFHQAEEDLYEDIDNSNLKFKGFIDAVISVPKGKDPSKRVIWILDWKTTGPMGWWKDKRRDFISHSQIGLYKKYWAKKYNVDLKDIRTGFVFLKRKPKPNKNIELFKVSTGPKFIEKSDKLVVKMLHNLSREVYIKNRLSCQFCPFSGTEHCK